MLLNLYNLELTKPSVVNSQEKDILNYKYKFDSETGILYKYYYGSITVADIISSWEFAIENNLIPKGTKGFVLDYRAARLDVCLSEHDKIPLFYRNHPDTFRDSKVAILVKHPRDIVIPILVKDKDEGYQSRPFSTEEAAVAWALT